MKTSSVIVGLAAAAPALAQRPMETSICDYYTTALLKENTAANQQTLLTLVVNTAVIGNYTTPNVGITVAGILAPGEVNGTAVNLAPYFSGALASSNRGNKAVAINFLDGGAAAPIKENKAANDETSNQYKLLTHLYQYFGALLGCSATDYPAYMGSPSMASVHKFMDLDQYEVTYFVQQVGMSAASFGVADADVAIVGSTLLKTFNYKCAPEATVIPAQGAQLQAICTADSCPLAENATCDAYTGYGVEPMNATSTSASPSGTSATSVPTPSFSGAASKVGYAIPAGLFAVAAFVL